MQEEMDKEEDWVVGVESEEQNGATGAVHREVVVEH
jgi:hypothetical protein